MTPKNRYNTAKYKKGDVIYFKSPSKYSRRKDPDTVEAILLIVAVNEGIDSTYTVETIKVIKNKPGHWTDVLIYRQITAIDSLEIETYSRKLTPAETVLYG